MRHVACALFSFKFLRCWGSVLMMGFFTMSASATPLPKVSLFRDYRKAVKLYYQNQIKLAKPYFQRVHQALQRTPQKLSPSLARIMRLDVEQFLASIAWERKRYREACLQHGTVQKKINRLPARLWLALRQRTAKEWEALGLEAGVMDRLDGSQHIYREECPKIPTKLTFQITPPHATLRFREQSGRWKTLRGWQAKVRGRMVILQTRAAGYQSDLRTLPLTPGSAQVVTLHLRKKDEKQEKKEKQQDPTKRPQDPAQGKQHLTQRPKQPTSAKPIYQQWWFWTGIGIAVVAAAVTTSVAVVLSQPNEQLRGKNDTPFRLWDR